MLKLWEYQEKGVDAILDYFEHGGNATILQQPTGTGKTLIASTFINRMREQKKPVYFVTASGALLEQFSQHLSELGQRHGIIKAGYPVIRYRVQVISVQSLMTRAHMIDEPYAVIFEEAHHAAASQFMKIIDIWPKVKILGLTATPARPDGKPLKMFDNIIQSEQPKWFIDNHYLSDFEYYAPSDMDITGLHTVGGDYNKKELDDLLKRKAGRISDMLRHYLEHADGKPAIAFGTSIQDSENIADQFSEAGYKMQAIHSKISDPRAVLDQARRGDLRYISSCDMVGEGVSVNGLTVELDGRPTKSLVIKLQHTGRVLRSVYAPGYDLSTKAGRYAAMQAGGKGKAIILDFSGNYLRHGFPDDDRTWSLDGAVHSDKGTSKYKTCPECQRPVLRTLMQCPVCKFEFERRFIDRTPKERNGKLVKLRTDRQSQELIRKIARQAKNFMDAVSIAESAGMSRDDAMDVWSRYLKKEVV